MAKFNKKGPVQINTDIPAHTESINSVNDAPLEEQWVTVEPEFNNGCITALVLFYAHQDQDIELDGIKIHDFRLNGAYDHIREMNIPSVLPQELKGRMETFEYNVRQHRVDYDIDDYMANFFFEESKLILNEITELFNVDLSSFLDRSDISEINWGKVTEGQIEKLKSLDKEIFGIEVIVNYG